VNYVEWPFSQLSGSKPMPTAVGVQRPSEQALLMDLALLLVL